MLVVIDMQLGFLDNTLRRSRRVINNVNRLITEAVIKHEPITLVEYKGCGHLLDEIFIPLRKYDKLNVVTKLLDDGSLEIAKVSNQNEKLNVCGVHWNQCVFSTVRGLLEKDFNCNAYKTASNPEYQHVIGNRWDNLLSKYGQSLRIL